MIKEIKKILKNIKKFCISSFMKIAYNIMITFLLSLIKESVLAFLPIIVIFVICKIKTESLPFVSFYNNLFVGFTTINIGNTMYFFSKEKRNTKSKLNELIFFISLISAVVTTIIVTINSIDELSNMETHVNPYYSKFSIILLSVGLVSEVIKTIDKIKDEEKKNDL